MGTQRRGHPGFNIKPRPETRNRLVEEHAKTIDRRKAPRTRPGKKPGLKRPVDNINDNAPGGHRRQVEIKRLFTSHAKLGGVDQDLA